MAGYEITPAHPPPPTAWNLLFQPDTGSQTSTLMSESAAGVSAAVTRQKAGTVAYGFATALARPAPPAGASARPPGATNAPCSTVRADVIEACGNASDASFSHVLGAAAVSTAGAGA